MKKCIIFGHETNSLAMILESIHLSNFKNAKIEIVPLMDNESIAEINYGNDYKISSMDIKIITPDDIEESIVFHHNKNDTIYLLAQSDIKRRLKTVEYFKEKIEFDSENYSSLIHPSASIGSTAHVGIGCYIGPNVSVGPYAYVGDFAFINQNVSIEHHTIIHPFCTLKPSCSIAGNCIIYEECDIGMGANIFDNLMIFARAQIGGGSVVTKNVPCNTLVYGVPAKVIRKK